MMDGWMDVMYVFVVIMLCHNDGWMHVRVYLSINCSIHQSINPSIMPPPPRTHRLLRMRRKQRWRKSSSCTRRAWRCAAICW